MCSMEQVGSIVSLKVTALGIHDSCLIWKSSLWMYIWPNWEITLELEYILNPAIFDGQLVFNIQKMLAKTHGDDVR